MSFTQNLRHSRISAFSKKNKGHYFVDRSGFLFRFLDLRNLCHSSGGDCCVHMAAVQIRVPPPRKTLENGWPFEPVGIFIFFLGQFLGLIRHIRNCWLINWSTLVDILGKEVAIGEIPSIHQRGKFLVDKNLAKRHNDAKRNDVTCTAWVSVLFFFFLGCNVLWKIFSIRFVCFFLKTIFKTVVPGWCLKIGLSRSQDMCWNTCAPSGGSRRGFGRYEHARGSPK